eukprot:218798_1
MGHILPTRKTKTKPAVVGTKPVIDPVRGYELSVSELRDVIQRQITLTPSASLASVQRELAPIQEHLKHTKQKSISLGSLTKDLSELWKKDSQVFSDIEREISKKHSDLYDKTQTGDKIASTALAREATFGDYYDGYYHDNVNSIGSGYSPSIGYNNGYYQYDGYHGYGGNGGSDDSWMVAISVVFGVFLCIGIISFVCCIIGAVVGWTTHKVATSGKDKRRSYDDVVSEV